MSLKGKLARLGMNFDGSDLSSTEMAILDGLTASTTEINNICDVTNSAMSASTVMAALLGQYRVTTVKSGNIIKTVMDLDLTGAKSTTTDLDVIGNTGACHIGQVTTAVNGIVYKATMSCAETPATGADDINLATATVATGAYDADASGLTGYVLNLDSNGAWTVGLSKAVTTAPAANSYLYLINGEAGTVGTYTAGKFIIEMWGLVV